jgi:hypothetical protein
LQEREPEIALFLADDRSSITEIELLGDGGGQGSEEDFRHHFVCGIFLQTMTVCPVLESMRVVTGSQRHDTVFAFSCLVTTQCSMTSAVGGGIWLRIGAGAATEGGGEVATGFFLPEQPTRHRSKMSHRFLIR